MTNNDLSVGCIGAGMMASALMEGMIAKGVVKDPASISCSDVWEPSRKAAEAKGIFATASNAEVCSRSKDAIILAVKPNIIGDVCKDVMAASGDSLVISIAAGVQLSTLEGFLPGRRVVRVMPNTPCLVGEVSLVF
jgi:pyrroline-5-carboxylate reductase